MAMVTDCQQYTPRNRLMVYPVTKGGKWWEKQRPEMLMKAICIQKRTENYGGVWVP